MVRNRHIKKVTSEMRPEKNEEANHTGIEGRIQAQTASANILRQKHEGQGRLGTGKMFNNK